MKILAVGDIVGSAGVNELKLRLKEIKENEKIDFCYSKWRKFSRGNGNYRKEF